ncbi:MAG: phage holin family protein [Anaerolineae bacterium]|jgi:putative membrane protein|nr:phage holin family protein [Anaerolineae bacterium]
MVPILSTLISLALVWVVGAVILMIVSRLGLGLSVDGFGAAFIASAVISIVTGVLAWLLGLIGITIGGPGLIAGLIGVVISAVILLISDRFVKGMKVDGFGGAIIAAIAYGAVTWLLHWVINLLF